MSARNKQRNRFPALSLCAAMAPLMSRCAGAGWLSAGLGAAGAAFVLTHLRRAAPCRTGEERLPDSGTDPEQSFIPRALGLIAGPMLLLLASRAAVSGTHAFAETSGDLTAAALLLALSLWAASAGPRAAERCGGILLRLVLGFFLIVTVFSLPQIRPEWLQPGLRPGEAVVCCGLLLAPGAAFWLHKTESERCTPLWLLLPLAAAAAAVTQGVLSAGLAQRENSFLTLARSVSVLGVIRRFEALVSGAMLPAWFCLCTLLLCSGRAAIRAAKNLPPAAENFAAAALCFLFLPAAKRLSLPVAATLCATSCGFIPIILLSVERKRFFREMQKKC